jgi:ABC-2 type transport system permease protein
MRTVRRTLPSTAQTMQALVRSDVIVQSRHRASIVMSVLIPLFFLFTWRDFLAVVGPTTVLASCISVGLPSIGLMGYALVVARDRELGVFQRLRTTPCATWVIMLSRWMVQLSIMIVMALLTVVAAIYIDDIHLSFSAMLMLLLAVVISGLLFLSLGQLIVALFQASETVNSATRVIYISVLVTGILAQTLPKDSRWHGVVQWLPVGVSRLVISGALSWKTRDAHDLLPFLATLTYTVIFATVGIHRFRWKTNG